MNLESIMLSEISQPERDKYHMVPLVCSKKKEKEVKIIAKNKWITEAGSGQNRERLVKEYQLLVIR